jgi:hypothetical protein
MIKNLSELTFLDRRLVTIAIAFPDSYSGANNMVSSLLTKTVSFLRTGYVVYQTDMHVPHDWRLKEGRSKLQDA